MAPIGIFFTFLGIVESQGKTRKLRTEQNMAGKRFCCLEIPANLHNLLRIGIKMAPAGTLFTFLVIVAAKGETIKPRTWPNMVRKRCLLFGDFCKSSRFAA